MLTRCMFNWLCGIGKQRRLQFVECPNDINGMIDCAKVADLALLLIDGSYGFEMVIFHFLLFCLESLSNASGGI